MCIRDRGIVSRLTDQKGFDLVAYKMEDLCNGGAQVVVLGTGDEKYENLFRHYAWKYPDRFSAQIYFSNEMSHKIYAAADTFLMPSRFEPCGLSQLISLRYGTLPIVRETGGLKDTVAVSYTHLRQVWLMNEHMRKSVISRHICSIQVIIIVHMRFSELIGLLLMERKDGVLPYGRRTH